MKYDDSEKKYGRMWGHGKKIEGMWGTTLMQKREEVSPVFSQPCLARVLMCKR